MEQKKLPIILMKNETIFPMEIKEITVSKKEELLSIKKSREDNNNYLLVATNLKINEKKPKNSILGYGVLVKILKINDVEKMGKIVVTVEGINRVTIFSYKKDKYGQAISSYVINEENRKTTKTILDIRKFIEIAISNPESLPFDVDKSEKNLLKQLDDSNFIDRFASFLPLTQKESEKFSSFSNVEKRFLFIIEKFSKIVNNDNKSISVEEREVKEGISERVREKVQSQQKEFYLREQLKAIQTELDELAGIKNEFDALRAKIRTNPYPKHIKEKALAEVKKLEMTPSQAQEANITRQYIDWLLNLPYWQYDEEIIDIEKARKILDSEHFGLDKTKEKIIEFLAVKQQNPKAKGSILALVGPPGTGKTTMAKSIAKSLNRKLIKISLGGVKDESEIRGHRRTYIASMPGKIIQAMKKAKVNNPIILLDELDKMSADYKGDPTSAMLEVLDFEQNAQFQDHYIEEEYDLSNVTFVATANYFRDIPEPLIDRLDVIEVLSYTELEKIQIFKKHLLKRIKNETKISPLLFKWTTPAIKELIRHYTIEAGVRQLYREGNTVARKLLVKKLSGNLKETKLTITPELLRELLGPKKYDYTKIDDSPQIGATTGLAWTQYGGDILPIEVTLFPGKGEIILTGQLKDVMKESATIALSYIKSNSEKFGVELKGIENIDIHIHSPDGATPKDGPSAGVTFTTAIISALSKRKVSQYIGMTGEITLRGHVLPIGGLKEKTISAYRSGLKTIFIPKENVKDLEEIPNDVREKLEIIPVERYDEIFNSIFN